jgi:signal transduction histidine kinase
MTSRSASISPGSASANGELPPARRRSLRLAVAVAFVPLCVVVVAGLTRVLLDARAVHQDLQRMFEELREVTLTRALRDELRGVEQWVEAIPMATPASHPLVLDDVRNHHRAAVASFARLATADDPADPEHQRVERELYARLATSLERIGTDLGSAAPADAPIAALRPALTIAVHTAELIGRGDDDASREIGNTLDQRSEGMVQFMLLLGVASFATVGGLALLLLRRVLVPVRELRAGALAFGAGQLDVRVPVRHPDELGELATTFMAMAAQLRANRDELNLRVEERSREVLRAARLADLGTLAAGIAHEVNNPLASIAACAEGLLRETPEAPMPPEQMRQYLEIIRKEAHRTRDLTKRLLEFARQGPPARELVWLGNAIRDVAAMFEHQLQRAGVALRTEIASPPPAVLGDGAEWRQVLFNLLRNALDASPRGGTITVTCRRLDGDVVLTVADEGTGIPQADLDRVFEPFFTTKAPGQGTGLGLSIVHRIVTAHGGRVRAANVSPRGAEFTVVLADATPSG